MASHQEDPESAGEDVFESAEEEMDLFPVAFGEDDDDDEGSEYVDEDDEDAEDDDYDEHDHGEHHAYIDAGGMQVEISFQPEDGEDDEAAGWAERNLAQVINLIAGGGQAGHTFLSRTQLRALLGTTNALADDDDEDHEWDEMGYGGRRRRRVRGDPDRFPKIPSDEGTELMTSGVFGSTDRQASSQVPKQKALARRILDRELGLDDKISWRMRQGLMAQSLIPTKDADMVIHYHDPVYSGQFSDDGNFFFSCVKDFKVRMYDTSNPYNWRHYKTVSHPFGQWTLTDASLSPDNKWLAYTSIQPTVCLAPTDPSDTGDPYTLNLSDSGNAAQLHDAWHTHHSFGIFSVRFSGDGRELVAGTNAATVVIYDIESRRVLHTVSGHEDDVNAVCFADKMSPHILYSGSDDATIKVWDRRSMGDGREAGAFVGHCEGLTYIDSKGDGRYILSNGKDQTMKLWDLRMAMSTEQFAEKNPMQFTRHSNFDYRFHRYFDDDWFKHPYDNSLVTFRGHQVRRTLIRCHFSPPGSTDSRYVYSGSYDGRVYVWNMDATIAAKIDIRDAASEMIYGSRQMGIRRHLGSACVREASWHPTAPILVASAWNGQQDFGSCTVHSYNDAREDDADPKMGRVVDDQLRPLGLRAETESPEPGAGDLGHFFGTGDW
ncbi:uncharacterized protein E0L32_005662 [Thyridium curvatum]|uniref:Uncharacterized protein n=1 Tax=Thyridium curvatum TaxID=1093900 RepID=A0A507AVG1_9PEZI|nr:uncharacterized protein E0L32_005662 [Thyridium curvatum]TPX13962.1 hypothetical protein E0L32_005662 [Thyridium curvatum]